MSLTAIVDMWVFYLRESEAAHLLTSPPLLSFEGAWLAFSNALSPRACKASSPRLLQRSCRRVWNDMPVGRSIVADELTSPRTTSSARDVEQVLKVYF